MPSRCDATCDCWEPHIQYIEKNVKTILSIFINQSYHTYFGHLSERTEWLEKVFARKSSNLWVDPMETMVGHSLHTAAQARNTWRTQNKQLLHDVTWVGSPILRDCQESVLRDQKWNKIIFSVSRFCFIYYLYSSFIKYKEGFAEDVVRGQKLIFSQNVTEGLLKEW